MAKIVERKGRSGFYLCVPVPSKLRKRLRKNAVFRKAGNTKAEALKRRTELLVTVENEFRRLLKEDVVSEVMRLCDPGSDLFMDLLDQTLRERGYKGGTDNLHTDNKLGNRTTAALEGNTDYTDWIQKRVVEEAPSKSTIRQWETRLGGLAKWHGSDYLTSMTKEDAVRWKNEKINELNNSSLVVYIGGFRSFWNWLIANGQVTENIWEGLTRKLKVRSKQEHVDQDVLDTAKELADQKKDIGFWIQYYTGCRKAEHQGLRYSDIDMTTNTIRFEQYTYKHITRNLKGREKDERTVPIHPVLREKILALLPDAVTNTEAVPIWINQYRESVEGFGATWSDTFSRRYGFTSHKLRSYVVTQLINNNVSPYMLQAVTRHSVPGMSQVVSGYVRPTMEQLREVINKLT